MNEDDRLRASLRSLDERLGSNVGLRKALRYVFPEHWSFLIGELALYAFIVLVATGTYLAFFFQPSDSELTYHGSYSLLEGRVVSDAYDSALRLSFDIPAGLLFRQTHHWAALVFVAAIAVHLIRIFFTGAFRKPRELNYLVGVTLLGAAILEGFLGYSLLDDLLSGMGLAIGYAAAMSIPLIGGDLAHLIWDGQFPGGPDFLSRLYIGHVFLLPGLIGVLIAIHLALIIRVRHTQFPGPMRTERNVIGTPMWPGYALRSTGLLLAVAAVLFLMGGLVQINPIWQWGPYEPYIGTNGAQPDWYLGWLIGALRLMPPVEIVIGGYTVVPNPFFGGLLFPTIVFAFLYLWPWIEQRFVTRDLSRHDLLDRPRDNPLRSAIGAAMFTWVFTVFAAGASDRLFLATGVGYQTQVWISRALVFVLPAVVFLGTLRWCRQLRDSEEHPLREWEGAVVVRTPDGGFRPVDPARERASAGAGPDAP